MSSLRIPEFHSGSINQTIVPTPEISKDLGPLRNLPRSAMASHIYKSALAKQQPFHYLLGAFLPDQVAAWGKEYFENRIGRRHPFQQYRQSSGIFPLQGDADGRVRISVAGDWGTGTREAAMVGRRMQEFQPHFTVHLGDVYYVGDQTEVLENFLGVADPKHNFMPCTFPQGLLGTFSLMGNHEMYARGFAYFDTLLPRMGMVGGKAQEASFFCLENKDWRVIALDTAYNSLGIPILENIFKPKCGLTSEQLAWLEDVFRTNSKQGTIFLTHHQYYSAFEESYVKCAQQLAEFVGMPVLWFWGHEHRMSIYGLHSMSGGIVAYGRCLGHGGMPIEINSPIKNPEVPLRFIDNRKYPSPENITVGYNGHANLLFDGPSLLVKYVDLMGTVVASESWTTTNGMLSGGLS